MATVQFNIARKRAGLQLKKPDRFTSIELKTVKVILYLKEPNLSGPEDCNCPLRLKTATEYCNYNLSLLSTILPKR